MNVFSKTKKLYLYIVVGIALIALIVGFVFAGKIIYENKFLPKVSVFVAVYNTAPYLDRCLTSLVNQTLKDIEIIVVNDGSTDNSEEIIQKYAKKDKRIVYIKFDKNQGLSATRNYSIKIARGKFIGFCDSDDYVDEMFFENLYNQSEGYDIVRGIVLKNGNYVHNKPYGCIAPSIFRRKFILYNKITFPYVPNEDAYFKKIAFKKTRRINETENNGIYYHYEFREGSLCNYVFDKEKNEWKGPCI